MKWCFDQNVHDLYKRDLFQRWLDNNSGGWNTGFQFNIYLKVCLRTPFQRETKNRVGFEGPSPYQPGGKRLPQKDSTERRSYRISSAHGIRGKKFEKSEMKKENLIIALAFEGLAIWMIVDSCRLGIQTLNNPGAGYFPFILGILLCLFGLPVFISSLKNFGRAEVRKEAEEIKYPILEKTGPVIASLIAYAVLLEILGFLITFFLLSWLLFWIANPRRWLFVSGLSALIAALSYLIFIIVLQVPFPRGIWR